MRTPRWKLEKADWQSFQMLSEVKCVEMLNKNITEVEEMNENVVTAITEAVEKTIPKNAGSKRKKCVWWDERCSVVIKNRNKRFKQLKAHHTLETLINYKRAQAVVRKTIRSAKRVYWRQFCNTTGRETQLSDIWNIIRKMSGIRQNVEIPVLCSNNKNAISNAEKAELLVKPFVKIHSSGNLSSTAKQYRDQTLAQNPGIVERSITSGGDLDQPFTLFELERAISNTRQTTPGKDGICHCMLGERCRTYNIKTV